MGFSLKKREKNNFSLLCRRPCFIQRSSGRTDEFACLSCLSQWLCVWWSDHLQVCDCLMYWGFFFCHFPPSHTTLSLYIHLLTILPFAMLLSSFYGDSRDRQWWVGHGGLLLGNTHGNNWVKPAHTVTKPDWTNLSILLTFMFGLW